MSADIDLTVPFNSRIRVETEDAEKEAGIVTVDARTAGPPLHRHADQDELWTCIEGRLSAQSGSTKTTIGPGETYFVPKSTPHTYWNDGDARCVFRYELTPGTRFTSMMRTFAMLAQDGRLRSTTDIRSIMHMAQVFVEFEDHVRAVSPPHWVMGSMAAIGRTLRIVRKFEAQ